MESTQISHKKSNQSEAFKLQFPKRVKHRRQTLATMYHKSKHHPFYRVAYRVNGHG